MLTAAEILRELVAIPTPSALSNLPLIEWVCRFVEAKGWGAEIFPYTDENGIAKANMIARPAAGASGEVIDLAFVCHTDTVPFRDTWSGALELQADAAQHLHGCGACDVKGSLACFLGALQQVPRAQLSGNVALILTADEEIGCKGMDRLLAATSLRIRSAIVSEPTSLRPGIAGKGYGLARVTVRGCEAHSAFPSEGISAITLAARVINRIEDTLVLPTATPTGTDALFDPPRTTVNIGVIQGGSAKNIIAGECTFLVEWRPVPSEDPHKALDRLNRVAASILDPETAAMVHIEPLRAEAGFAPAAGGALQHQLTAVTGRFPVGISFGSEASRLARIAEEVIVIGPGDMHTAHSDRECVPAAELEEWTAILTQLLTQSA